MTLATVSGRRLSGLIVWTGVGAVTAIAALVLMFWILLFASGPLKTDSFEADGSYVLGAIGIAVWLPLVIVAGRRLVKDSPGRRRSLAVLPALVSAAWCGLAVALLTGGSPVVMDLLFSARFSWPGPLWAVLAASVLSAGAIPVGLALFLVNVVLLSVRRRREERITT